MESVNSDDTDIKEDVPVEEVLTNGYHCSNMKSHREKSMLLQVWRMNRKNEAC